jgi:hypothetical protein
MSTYLPKVLFPDNQIEISPPPTKAMKGLAYVTGNVTGSLGAAQLGEEDGEVGGLCL